MKLKDLAILIASISILYSFLNFIGIGCPIKFLTGIPCAGCGMTRAMLSFLSFNFHQAFKYHPLFFFVPILLIIFSLKSFITKPLFNNFLFIISLIFIIVYFCRLLNPADTIVKIDFKSSALWQLFEFIKGVLKNMKF